MHAIGKCNTVNGLTGHLVDAVPACCRVLLGLSVGGCSMWNMFKRTRYCRVGDDRKGFAVRCLQVMLVFTESILIAQYVYQIPSRLHCSAATPRVRALAKEAGLHGNALRGVPIFCVYLATLMHTYSLARQKVHRFARIFHDMAIVMPASAKFLAEGNPTILTASNVFHVLAC